METLDNLVNWIEDVEFSPKSSERDKAASAFRDTLACILAAYGRETVNKLSDYVQATTVGASHLLGGGTASPEGAAFVNATAAHLLDFDDNFMPAVTHASAILVPTLIAVGEAENIELSDLLDAYIVGLEVQAWLGRYMIPEHYAEGWHATSTIGAIGAAAAVSKSLRLKGGDLKNAMSIATSMAAGSKIQFGSEMKPIHAGLAGKAGVTAAYLAKNGVGGNGNPFEGDWGFIRLHHGRIAVEEQKKDDLAINTAGLAQKRWPCCASSHRTLDGVLDLINRFHIKPEDIASIDTIIPETNFKNLRFDSPQTPNEARFSLHYPLCVLVVTGKLALDDFSDVAIHRANIRSFMTKINMVSHPPATSTTGGLWRQAAETKITLNDGKEFHIAVEHPVGTIFRPLNETEIKQKFVDCAQVKFSAEEAENIYNQLLTLEKKTAADLGRLLQ